MNFMILKALYGALFSKHTGTTSPTFYRNLSKPAYFPYCISDSYTSHD